MTARTLALLGGESSGKTTLARALAQRLGTAWVHEYGRELWEARDGALEEHELLDIAVEQIRREDEALPRAHGWLVCDTTPLTTLGYAHWTHGRADPRLAALAMRRYDRVLLCEPDFAHVQDGWRREAAFRDEQHAWYLARLQAGDTPWLRVGGPVSERVNAVLAWLAQDQRLAALEGQDTCTPPR